jgi:hypothetical protein
MKKENLLALITKAELSHYCNLSYREAERLKNAVLDEVIKELQELKLEIEPDAETITLAHSRGVNLGLRQATKTIEAMK